MDVPINAKDAAPTITNFNIESPAPTNDKSRTNLTLLRAQQTDSRASNNAIFFDECCGNGTRVFHEKLSYFGSLLHLKAPPALAASPPFDGPKPSSCTLPRRTPLSRIGLGRDYVDDVSREAAGCTYLYGVDFPFLADPQVRALVSHQIFQ